MQTQEHLLKEYYQHLERLNKKVKNARHKYNQALAERIAHQSKCLITYDSKGMHTSIIQPTGESRICPQGGTAPQDRKEGV